MAHPLTAQWHRAAVAALPPGMEIWDGHTHTGSADPDGFTNDPERLLADLDDAGHAGAVVAPSHDPAGYRAQNARVLAEAQASEGRIIPYMRVDPKAAGAADDVRRGLAEGFRGVKLHPRSESFGLDHPGVVEVAAAAAHRRAPLLIHSGRGIPPLGESVLHLIDGTPGLVVILAHAGISDLAWIADEARTRPGLMFDTAWWNAADLLTLFARVDASQIVYASDMPYWSSRLAATITTRAAIQAGVSGSALRSVFGGSLHRVLAGDPHPGPLGTGVSGLVDPGLLRIASNLYGAIAAARVGTVDIEGMQLALRAAEAAQGPYEPLLAAIRATITSALDDPVKHPMQVIDLLFLACAAALTPAVSAPDIL